MDSPSSIASRLKKEANELLFDRGVEQLLTRHGKVVYAGSYALDLMAWPDIDLNLVVAENRGGCVAAELASEFINWDECVRVKFERDLNKAFPNLPKGIYLGVKLDIGEWNIPWKLDVWIVDAEESLKTQEKMEEVRKRLNPSNREIILAWKQQLMTPQGRTPSFSGYWLYEAILFHGMTSDKEILDFLREKGVKL